MKHCNLFLYLILALFAVSCTQQPTSDKESLYVSVLPLKGIVKQIVGDDFRIEVLVPSGASPETFEPTPRQFVGLNQARLIFNVGLIPFEKSLLSKLDVQDKIVNLSHGIDLIEGMCSHVNPDHAHGVDPHVWTAPKALKIMAENAFKAIEKAYPDSVKYAQNHAILQERLTLLDQEIATKIEDSGLEYFIIYHPAFTYFARDYGIRQVAIEDDGKEPSAKQLARLIEQARKDDVRRIFCQSQFPRSTVEIISFDVDAEVVMVDPLREDVEQNIREITDLMTKE